MSDQEDANGWAPLDPDMGDGRARPPAPDAPPPGGPGGPDRPGERPEQGPAAPRQQQSTSPYGLPPQDGRPGARPQGGQEFPQQQQQWTSPYGLPQHGGGPYGGQAPDQAYPAGHHTGAQPAWDQNAWGGQYPQGYPQQYQYPPGYAHGYGPGYGGYPQPVKRPWIVPTPRGVPFHRMARSETHSWWRPLVGTLAIIVVGLGAGGVLAVIGLLVQMMVSDEDPALLDDPGTTSIFGNDTADIAYALGSLALFLPLIALAAWGIQRRRPGTLSSVAGRLRWRWMLACAGMSVVFCAVSFVLSMAAGATVENDPAGSTTEGSWVGWDDFLLPALVIVALVPFQSAAEEYFFRGWLMQAIGACTLEKARNGLARALSVVFRTPWPGIVVGAALFTSGHGYTGWGMLDIFVFGAIAGWLTVRTGGLECTIALHVFNNLMAFLLPAALGQLSLEQGGIPWQYVLADVTSMAVYAVGIVLLARRFKVRTVTPGDGPGDGPADDPGPDAPQRPGGVPGAQPAY
ncbi:CPBP family intramembrane glutamic endopeptidase [Actinomadura sp. WMMB 499]|uniref:CPBP family intramembrane glutamic endopeptidase n=1 Tax=Actinomadura sp. WMMB 499 TaxID=1219491 RepID=UPI001243B7AE|nr:CPBP family intramembrane glutamic endopeptidase [Actinomadura sp. WMMB 499]QFG24977.1 CPBP family intramembrane metalloprotease [Actinomadura sp. WMMB 499]